MNRMIIIVLSGLIGSGKSTVAACLRNEDCRACTVSTSDVIKSFRGKPVEGVLSAPRDELRRTGDDLDSSNPLWLVNAIVNATSSADDGGYHGAVCVDAVRSAVQVETLRNAFGDNMLHVHIDCPVDTAIRRASRRGREGDSGILLHSAMMQDAQNARSLADLADVVVNSDRMLPQDVAVIVAAHVARLRGRASIKRCVDVLVGGQFGSEGKGYVMQHIAPEYSVLCRVGGPNAGHSVTNPSDGRKVSFYHLPSGLLHAQDADILIGAGAVINPIVLEKEIRLAESLGCPVRNRLLIDTNAMIIDPQHVDSERGIVGTIGSTGQGVGEATVDKIRRGGARLAKDHTYLRVGDTREYLERKMSSGARVMMEGTQGTLLSLHHGYYPFVTSRDTAASGTLGEMGIPPGRVNRSIMVCRTNPIRVQSPDGGTSGPMGVELTWEDIARRSGMGADELREIERTTTTKRLRRIGEFSFAQLQRACLLNAPTDIALTFVDYVSVMNRGATQYRQLTAETHDFINHIETVARAPVSLISTGFTRTSFIDRRRSW